MKMLSTAIYVENPKINLCILQPIVEKPVE